jgi:hypothetical protein
MKLAMRAAAGDVALADAFERIVCGAVDDAIATIGEGADAALAGGVAGKRFRAALASQTGTQVATSQNGRRAGGPTTARATLEQIERRADAFRRMAGIRR